MKPAGDNINELIIARPTDLRPAPLFAPTRKAAFSNGAMAFSARLMPPIFANVSAISASAVRFIQSGLISSNAGSHGSPWTKHS
jgi:hypothetical protein